MDPTLEQVSASEKDTQPALHDMSPEHLLLSSLHPIPSDLQGICPSHCRCQRRLQLALPCLRLRLPLLRRRGCSLAGRYQVTRVAALRCEAALGLRPLTLQRAGTKG